MRHQTFEGQGYRLLSATSGEGALRIAQKAKPDLILLDIMMPGIDGYETCARLKADESTQNTVIIFLTALHDTKEKVHGLSLGAVDFITKPFDPDEVIARVARQLQVHHGHKALLAKNQELASRLENELRSGATDLNAYREKIKSLISSGESDRLEFKSTLRWNLKTDRSEKGIEKAWLKSMVAFLNTDGGVLLVGVDDVGVAVGAVDDLKLLVRGCLLRKGLDDAHAAQVLCQIADHLAHRMGTGLHPPRRRRDVRVERAVRGRARNRPPGRRPARGRCRRWSRALVAPRRDRRRPGAAWRETSIRAACGTSCRACSRSTGGRARCRTMPRWCSS